MDKICNRTECTLHTDGMRHHPECCNYDNRVYTVSTSSQEGFLTTDDWSEKHHPELIKDIECHIENYIKDKDDVYNLRRMIFISMRQHDKTGL